MKASEGKSLLSAAEDEIIRVRELSAVQEAALENQLSLREGDDVLGGVLRMHAECRRRLKEAKKTIELVKDSIQD